MKHYYTTQQNEHYGVSYNEKYILVQLQGAIGDSIEQVRIPLTIEEAEHMIQLLHQGIENHKKYKTRWDEEQTDE